MGLAASQARFLGLTARKSNIEYEGQQVNQQRTALAEEVNSLYNSLAALQLPIAPDATQYYKSNYSFSVDNSKGLDGDYIIKSYYKNDDGTYYLNTSRSYNKNVAAGTVVANSTISKEDDVYYYKASGSEKKIKLTASEDSSAMRNLINSTYGEGTIKDTDTLYYYQDDEGLTHYFSKAQMDNREASSQKISSYTSSNKSVTETKIFEKASVTFDANNRISGVQTDDMSADVETTTIYDSDGYDAALRNYTMSKDEYNRKVQELNAKTESLQQEDKVLEMRLDQIDTEQNELKTELEAVKKVLEDNIESTFKTFS